MRHALVVFAMALLGCSAEIGGVAERGGAPASGGSSSVVPSGGAWNGGSGSAAGSGGSAGAPDPAPNDPPPDPPPDVPWTGPASSDVWKMAGVFVYDPKTFSASSYGPVLKANHIGWVALQIVDGNSEKWPCSAEPCENDTAAGFIRSWRPWVKWVGAWGVNRANGSQGDVEAEAARALELMSKYDAAKANVDFFIADAEAEYEYSKCGACVSASAWWAAKFRAGRPAGSFEAAVSSYGRTDLADVYWMSWKDQGFHFLPQAYWNDASMSSAFKPSACVDMARICPGSALAANNSLNCTGSPTDCPCWPLDEIHPTIGLGWGANPVTADDYVADLASAHALGSEGFSIFEGQYLPPADDAWSKLGAAIENDAIAVAP
jgi:hypothetical protein